MSGKRTLWEEGRHPGRLVVVTVGALALAVELIDLAFTHDITVLFDVVFVLLCVGAALAVRPRDFFVVGVLPPLLMALTFLLLAAVDRNSVGDAGDGIVQAVVSGLARHSRALVIGYGLTLAILALRQVALRNAGTLRGKRQTPRRTSSHATF